MQQLPVWHLVLHKVRKLNLKTDVDSLSYAIGMARTEGLDQYLAQQGIDSTQMSEFLKGFNEGAAKIDKKDVAYMAGLQIGQMVSKQWVEGFNQQIFGNDSTQTSAVKICWQVSLQVLSARVVL